MKNLMMVVGALTMAVGMIGCVSTEAADVDKVAKWQKERTPVAVLQSKIAVKSAGAIVEAVDVAPYGLYKSIADKVDKEAVMERSGRVYLGYVGDIQALEAQGKTREEARKEVTSQILAQPDGDATMSELKAYLDAVNESFLEAAGAWIVDITAQLQAATAKFAQEMPNALGQIAEIAQQEGGMAIIRIPAQAKDDLAVVGDQLKDAGKGLALYVEMIEAARKVAKVKADYPIEG